MMTEDELVEMAGEKIGNPEDIKRIYTDAYGEDNGYNDIQILYTWAVFYMQQFYGDYEEPLVYDIEKAETAALTFMLAISFNKDTKMNREALKYLGRDDADIRVLKKHWALLKRGIKKMK